MLLFVVPTLCFVLPLSVLHCLYKLSFVMLRLLASHSVGINNSMFGHRHLTGYDAQYETCAAVIRAFRCLPYNNHDNEEMIRTISCD